MQQKSGSDVVAMGEAEHFWKTPLHHYQFGVFHGMHSFYNTP